MTCVACGYEPTEKQRLEQPYACPKCELESWRPPLSKAMKDCVTSLAKAAFNGCIALTPLRARQLRF